MELYIIDEKLFSSSLNQVSFHEFSRSVVSKGYNNFQSWLFQLLQDNLSIASQNTDAIIFFADQSVFVCPL